MSNPGQMKVGLARAILARRTKLGLNQTELAARAGVTRQAVFMWETRFNSVKVDGLPRLAQALDMTTVDLVKLACKLGGCQ